jgi:hypothetical protein
MELRDLLIAPIYLLIIYALAYRNRNKYWPKGSPLHKYYMTGLNLKLFGAVAAGLIYFFYYKDGDTIYYFQRTSIVYHAFGYSFKDGMRLIFTNFTGPDSYDLASYAEYLRAFDTSAYMVVRIASVISLFTFGCYTAIALFFAYFSFKGVWALFLTLTEIYPDMVREMAIACFFIPSVFFWGSGLFKDTITFAGVCWMTRSSYLLLFKRQSILKNLIIFFVSFYFTFTLKAYIALCFVPSLMIWIFFTYGSNIKSTGLRILAMPVILVIAAGLGYLFLRQAGSGNSSWSLGEIQDRAKDMQWWHKRVLELYGTEGGGGSYYHIGDGSFSIRNLLISFPQAVVVSLFRPFIWEVRNPVTLLASLEGMVILYFTLKMMFSSGIGKIFKYSKDYPLIFFCFFFSIVFAFAVGFTSDNFGALVRYKIPLIPFYVAGLFMVQYHANKDKKRPRLARTE